MRLVEEQFMKSRLIYWFLAGSIVLVLLAAGYLQYQNTRIHVVRIGATPGNISETFGSAFAEIVHRENPQFQIQLVETAGSSESMQFLGEGKLHLAVVQNDTPAVPQARTVAFVYPQFFHLMTLNSSPIQSVADLGGRRVGTPAAGGGSYNAFMQLIEYYDLAPEDFAAFANLPSAELGPALLHGDLDAIFSSDAIGEERPAMVLGTGEARLVAIDQAAAMKLTRPYIEELAIPKGAYKADPPVPPQDLTTVAIQTSLLAHKDLDAEIVRELTRILFDFHLELATAVPQISALQSPVASASLSIPVHTGALAYFNRERPNFLEENLGLLGLLATLAPMVVSIVLAMRKRIADLQRRRADQYNQEIIDLLDKVLITTERAQLDEVESRLFAMFEQVIQDIDQDHLTADSLGSFTLSWNQAIETVRHRRIVLSGKAEAPAYPASVGPSSAVHA